MRFFCILLAIVLVCFITVEGRNLYEQNTDRGRTENIDKKHERSRTVKHKRSGRSYRSYNGKSIQNIGVGNFLRDILFSVRQIETHVKENAINKYPNPNYYDKRRDYSNKCEDSVQELLALYKSLALQLKYSTPLPPQIIYIPYPVPTSSDQTVFKIPSAVNITNRNSPVDTKQISMDTPRNISIEDDRDGSRSISFRPIQSKRPHVIPPPFEHGSTQAGIQRITTQTLKKLGACKAAVLSCCISKTEKERENCFGFNNCSRSYKSGFACHPQVIEKILDEFLKLQGPMD